MIDAKDADAGRIRREEKMMTTGQLVFYAGVGLFILTVVLAVWFWIKKPEYDPGGAAYMDGAAATQRLRSGYPTDRLTIRCQTAETCSLDTAALEEDHQKKSEDQTELLSETAASQGTERLSESSTERSENRTGLLTSETETLPLSE